MHSRGGEFEATVGLDRLARAFSAMRLASSMLALAGFHYCRGCGRPRAACAERAARSQFLHGAGTNCNFFHCAADGDPAFKPLSRSC